MTVPEHIAELWLRYDAGLPLADEEQAVLMSALANDASLRKALLDDSAFDAQLRNLPAIEASGDAFARKFSERLATAGRVEVPPPAPAIWVEPPPVQTASPVTFVAPVPGVRPAVVKSVAASATRRPRKLDPALAVACSVLVLTGAVVFYATIWRHRDDASRLAVKNVEANPPHDHTRLEKQPRQESVDEPLREEMISPIESTGPEIPSTVVLSPAPSPRAVDQPQRMTTVPVATAPVTKVPLWKTGGPRSDRLPAGRHELGDGLAFVRLNNDREIELAAPAVVDVGADDTLTLLRGTLRTTKVAPDVGLKLATPTSRVFDRGGRFEIAVDDTGATNVVVAEGCVACQPGGATDKPCKLLELADDALNQLKIFNRLAAPGDSIATALTSVATGKDNLFLGQVSVNGETVEFTSPKAFEEFRQKAMGQFQQAPEQFLKQWSEMLKSVDGLNGGLPAGTSSFDGVININGQEKRFNSREEYEAALKNFLPGANFPNLLPQD